MEITLKSIGTIKSCYPDKFGTPRQPGLVQEAWAEIFLSPEVQPEISLQGLEGFSHLWVMFLFHKNETARYHAKVHPPRLQGKTMGLFATRTPHRPNPIGLSLVKIIEVRSGSVVVAGADIIDGTPVLDIKPYLPEVEAKPDARVGWTSEVQASTVEVEWSEEQLQSLQDWSAQLGRPTLKNLIEETLRLDPRPLVYKGFEGSNSPYRQNHAVRFFDGDIHFQFLTPEKIKILEVRREKV